MITIKNSIFLSLLFYIFTSSYLDISVKANNNKQVDSKFYQLGQSELKFLGLKLYNIKLLSDSEIFSYDNQIKIIINYNRDISKSQIIKTSLDQIYRQNKSYSKSIINKYNEYLDKSIVNVKKNDFMTAHYYKDNISFYHNKKYVSSIKDDQFAIDFLKIWLGDNSLYPKITKELLNIDE